MNEIETLNKIRENYKFNLYDYKKFCVEFTYHTQKLEGSTLTFEENNKLLLDNEIPERDVKFVTEHERHYNLLLNGFISEERDLTNKIMLGWHWALFKETREKEAGNIRSWNIYDHPTWNEVPYYLDDLFIWYNNTKHGIHPIYLASIAHLKLMTIYPFGYGNGIIARLTMNFILHKNGYPMIIIPYEDRRNYFFALENSQSGKGDWRFVDYITKLYIEQHSRLL